MIFFNRNLIIRYFIYRRESILPSLEELKLEFNQLYTIVSKIKSPVVFAHNDLLLGNILYNNCDNRVIFIDYEYADYNYQAYDIGNHFAEFAGKFIEVTLRFDSN